MDTQRVIKITGRAADSVLRFRTIAFKPRPFVDVKSIRAAIATLIGKFAKDDGNRFETPLIDVVRYAGMAASRAAQSWNDVSDKENHVDTEWFRNCVCDLVSGAVNDIRQKAFEYNDLNASEYLEPDDYDPFDVSIYSTDRRSSSQSSSSDVGSANYGFARGASKKLGEGEGAEKDTEQLPLRHEITRGWKAIHKLAASRKSSNSTASFIEATTPLNRKRGSPSNTSDIADHVVEVTKDRTKRLRAAQYSPTVATTVTGQHTGAEGGADTKKKVLNKCSWTNDEVEMMFKGREDGKSWDSIQASLPRHSRGACQTKYRGVLKQKAIQEISVVHSEQECVSSPNSGSQDDAEDDAGDEQDMNE